MNKKLFIEQLKDMVSILESDEIEDCINYYSIRYNSSTSKSELKRKLIAIRSESIKFEKRLQNLF